MEYIFCIIEYICYHVKSIISDKSLMVNVLHHRYGSGSNIALMF